MKRKRSGAPMEEAQTYDLVLTDATGRSVRAHRALLIDKSDYFAKVLVDNNLSELQLNENYLVELIHYLYNNEFEDQQRIRDSTSPTSSAARQIEGGSEPALGSSASIMNGDIEILMQLLVLSKKYGFRQLYRKLMNEINYKLDPTTVLTVYKCAREMGIEEIRGSTQMMILSWLPRLQTTNEFLSLSESSINEIFSAEDFDVESDSKLNALSAWWSHNKEADMTNLWVQLISSTYR